MLKREVLEELKKVVAHIDEDDITDWSIDNGDIIFDIEKYGKRIRIGDIIIEEEEEE